MSRIKELFDRKKGNVLSIYCTAGFPELNDTVSLMKALEDAGADMIELGMPYSDPLADGPVIQSSGAKAIANGMTIQTLFQQLKEFRKEVTIPIVLMGYMNPVLQYGFDAFCKDAAAVGIDGLILPDLPLYEFEHMYGQSVTDSQLDFIFMITPETSDERIRELDKRSKGFLYAVSSSSTTGQQASLASQSAHFHKLRSMQLDNPILIGFGIRTQADFETASSFAQGAIIGTAFIQAIEKEADPKQAAANFVKAIRPL